MDHFEQYKLLLQEYYEMLYKEPWWDGRRDKLVTRMDFVWDRLSIPQKKEIVKEVCPKLYEKYQSAIKS